MPKPHSQQQPVPVAAPDAPDTGPTGGVFTPQQLTDDLKASGIAEFGADASANSQVFPSKYFDHSVMIIAPDGSTYQRDPGHCATVGGAAAVASLFTPAPKIVLGNAVNFGGLLDGWSDSREVPYLQFPNGAIVNAALMLQYFNHNYPAAFALAAAGAEINGQ